MKGRALASNSVATSEIRSQLGLIYVRAAGITPRKPPKRTNRARSRPRFFGEIDEIPKVSGLGHTYRASFN